MSYEFSQFKTGQKVSCKIEGESCEGEIYVNYDNRINDEE